MKKYKLLLIILIAFNTSLFANNTTPNSFITMVKEKIAHNDKVSLSKNNQDVKILKVKLVTNITDAKGLPYQLDLDIVITFKNNIDINKIENKYYIFKDIMIYQISARSLEEILTVGGKAMMKEELIEKFNKLIFNDTSVLNVYYDKFLVFNKLK